MAIGGVLVRDTTGLITQTGPSTATFVLTSNGLGAVPTFQANTSSGVDFVVLSDGANPPSPVNDGAGNFIYVPYTP